MKFLNLKFKNTLINIYNSIEVLPLYNFDKFMSTKDNNWFLKSYDGRQKKENIKELINAEKIILDEYFTIINDASFQSKLQKWAKLDNLFTKYEVIKSICNRIILGFGTDEQTRILFIFELKKWGFVIYEMANYFEDIQNCNIILIQINGIKTQIKMLNDQLKIESQQNTKSLQQQLQIATTALDYKFMLKAKEITVSDWIAICEQLKELLKNN